MIDHVTYEIGADAIDNREGGIDRLDEFFDLLGFVEIEPDDEFEHGYNVRWFENSHTIPKHHPRIHVVARERTKEPLNTVALGLGHFCVRLGERYYREAADSPYAVRESGSGRAWLQYASIRVEIRP